MRQDLDIEDDHGNTMRCADSARHSLDSSKEMQRRRCHIPRQARRRLPQPQQIQPRAPTPLARSARQRRPGRRRRRRRARETCQNYAQQKFIRNDQQLSASAGIPTRRRRGCSSCPARHQRRSKSVSLKVHTKTEDVYMHVDKSALVLNLLLGTAAMKKTWKQLQE